MSTEVEQIDLKEAREIARTLDWDGATMIYELVHEVERLRAESDTCQPK